MLSVIYGQQKIKLSQQKDPDRGGVDIIARAIEAPLRQIVNNAGVDGSVVVEKVKAMDEKIGYNADILDYHNLVEDGVIDPANVVRCALENASSIAALVLTTETIIAEKKEKKDDK